jgi:hypothetical protein
MTAPDVRELVAAGRLTVSVPEAGAILGLGRTRSFELARDGALPGVRKLGERYFVSTVELLAWLGCDYYALATTEEVAAKGDDGDATTLTQSEGPRVTPRATATTAERTATARWRLPHP